MEKKQLALVKGQPYLVKVRNGKKIGITVRRIYKGEEMGFGNIKRFVFTSRVNRGAYADVTTSGDKITYTYHNLKINPVSELSVPYYDLIYITPAPNL